MPLYTDIRPKSLDELYGNRSTIEAIRALFEDGPEKAPRAFLLTGPSGTGKTTTARIIASMVGCSEIDLVEMNAADSRGIDTIRELIARSEIRPMASKYRVFILDEFHQSTGAAQNCLLKAIEDGPKHCFWIICTTDLQGIIKTIQNRCNIFRMNPLRPAEMAELIRKSALTLTEDGIEPELIELISEASGGSPRKALVILEKVIFVPSLKDAKEIIKAEPDAEAGESTELLELLKAVSYGKNPKKVIGLLSELQDDPEKTRIALVNFCGNRLLKEPEKDSVWLVQLIQTLTREPAPMFSPTAKSDLVSRILWAFQAEERTTALIARGLEMKEV